MYTDQRTSLTVGEHEMKMEALIARLNKESDRKANERDERREREMAEWRKQFAVLKEESHKDIKSFIAGVTEDYQCRLDGICESFNSRFDVHDEAIGKLMEDVTGIKIVLDRHSILIGNMEVGLGKVEGGLKKVEVRLDKVEGGLKKVKVRLSRVEKAVLKG